MDSFEDENEYVAVIQERLAKNAFQEKTRVQEKRSVQKREVLARSKGKHTAREAQFLLAVERRKEMEAAAEM